MKIAHISDSHSCFLPFDQEADIIVHSGDLLPNMTRGKISVEIPFQTKWIENHIENFRDYIGNRKFLYTPGNHDFIDVCQILQKHGVDAVNLSDNRYIYNNVSFYGFPYIPYICGEWNYECQPGQMSRHICRLKDNLEKGIDVIVAHAPIYGIMDTDFFGDYHFGIREMADLFSYGVEQEKLPKLYLHGHAHAYPGSRKEFGIKIVNSATTSNVVEI